MMTIMGGLKPLFIKIAPDLTLGAVDDVIEVALEEGVGIISANTTINEEIKAKYGWRHTPGGLSGNDPEFRAMSTGIIKHIYRQTRGSVPIMGAGAINDTKTALEKITAGAPAFCVVSGLRQKGLGLPTEINCGLVEYMEKHGVKSIQELVGIAA